MADINKEKLSRREALKKLGTLSKYSAPAVTTLLAPSLSHAQASLPSSNPSCENGFFGAEHPGQFGADNQSANYSDGFFGLRDLGNYFFNDTGRDC